MSFGSVMVLFDCQKQCFFVWLKKLPVFSTKQNLFNSNALTGVCILLTGQQFWQQHAVQWIESCNNIETAQYTDMVGQHAQKWDLWTLFSLLAVPKKISMVLWDVHTIWFEINAAHCAASTRVWVQNCNILCELFDFRYSGPWGRIFFVKQMPKTLDFQKPAPKLAKDKKL